jgi:hypothetical protein
MSTRWTPDLPTGQPYERQQPAWKRYLLPVTGVVAVLLMIAIVFAVIASGGDDDDEDSENETELAIDAETTETAMADVTPTPEVTEEAPTPTPVADEDEDEDAEESAEDELTPTPTPTEPAVDEEVAAEPTPVSEQEAPESEPEQEPVVGEFGELPAGDMPSGSPAEALSLQFNLNMNLQAMPAQANAYQIQRPQWSLEEAQNVAGRLGIDGEVVDQGGGSFRAEGSSASLHITPSNIQYVRSSSPEGVPELPDNDTLVQMSRSWLTDNGLVGTGVGSGQVLDRNPEAGNAYVLLKPSEPAEIISGTPSASVFVRGDGVVTEASINWPAGLSGSTYSLRPAEDLWADAISGRGFVNIRASDLPANFQGASATATITNGGIAYTVAGSPQGTQYLVPVAVFSGTVSVEGSGGDVPVRIYVQAAAAQAVPRG